MRKRKMTKKQARQMAHELLIDDLLCLRYRYDQEHWIPAPYALQLIDQLLATLDPTGAVTADVLQRRSNAAEGFASTMNEILSGQWSSLFDPESCGFTAPTRDAEIA